MKESKHVQIIDAKTISKVPLKMVDPLNIAAKEKKVIYTNNYKHTPDQFFMKFIGPEQVRAPLPGFFLFPCEGRHKRKTVRR